MLDKNKSNTLHPNPLCERHAFRCLGQGRGVLGDRRAVRNSLSAVAANAIELRDLPGGGCVRGEFFRRLGDSFFDCLLIPVSAAGTRQTVPLTKTWDPAGKLQSFFSAG